MSSDKNELGSGMIKFIQAYKVMPILWDLRLQDYTNRRKREKCYEKLILHLKGVKRNPTVADVKRKINILRSNFRKELRKVKDSESLDRGTNAVYEPKSWIFKELEFLRVLETPSATGSSTPQEDSQKTQLFNNSTNSCNSLKLSAIPTENLPPVIESIETNNCKRDSGHLTETISAIEGPIEKKRRHSSTGDPSTLPLPHNPLTKPVPPQIQVKKKVVTTQSPSSPQQTTNAMLLQQTPSIVLPNQNGYFVSQPANMLFQQPQGQPLQFFQPLIQPQPPNQYHQQQLNSFIYPQSELISQPNITLMSNGQTNQLNVPGCPNADTIGNNTTSNVKANGRYPQSLDENVVNGTSPNNQELGSYLLNLIELQKESNEINRERLEIERGRAAFEKSMAEKLINMLPNLIQIKINPQKQQESTKEPTPTNNKDEKLISSDDQDDSINSLLIPKVECELSD